MATASDDEVSTFAADHKAVLLTHDKEMFRRRRDNTFGYHVLLDCAEWDAPDIVGAHLTGIVEAVGTREALCMKLSKEGLKIYPGNWK